MLFNSLDFFIFLAVVLPLYFLLPLRGRQCLLVVASFYFYMYWNVKYAAILVFFIFVDFFAGYYIGHSSALARKKIGLALSLSCNLGVLAVFKYYNFFSANLHDVGLISSAPSLGLLLPLGISFHTFQTMSYTIDVYRGVIPAETSLLRFAFFVSFFPQLVAGPIERARELLPQIRLKHALQWDNFVAGSQQMLTGFVKKVVFADNLAPWVNQVYAAPGEYSGLSLLLATYMFAWQIYFDFSGYSDIAIGVARIMGFRFVENFNMPYIAASIQEFWRRWHISLSSWLRDYLYVSLGGNRRGHIRTYANLLITMLLGGLWHGASWNFVIWGGLHGGWLAMERMWKSLRPESDAHLPKHPALSSLAPAFRRVLVFHGVCLTWVFFRAATLRDSITILSRTLRWEPGLAFHHEFGFLKCLLTLSFGLTYFLLVAKFTRHSTAMRWAASTVAVLLIVLFGAESREFIYFVF
jgi:D-alanyl-lipoteichoic acid acyltransferase DltB (MBOAT superfamily)